VALFSPELVLQEDVRSLLRVTGWLHRSQWDASERASPNDGSLALSA
jgi:hypothetical protein